MIDSIFEWLARAVNGNRWEQAVSTLAALVALVATLAVVFFGAWFIQEAFFTLVTSGVENP